MKKLFAILVIALSACGRSGTTVTPGPSTPTPPTTPTASTRMPLPQWKADTFYCYNPNPSVTTDSFITSIGIGGASLLTYNGTTYHLWIDTAFIPYKADQQQYIFGMSSTAISDDLLNTVSQYYPYKFVLSGKVYESDEAFFVIPDNPFNANTVDDYWFSR